MKKEYYIFILNLTTLNILAILLKILPIKNKIRGKYMSEIIVVGSTLWINIIVLSIVFLKLL